MERWQGCRLWLRNKPRESGSHWFRRCRTGENSYVPPPPHTKYSSFYSLASCILEEKTDRWGSRVGRAPWISTQKRIAGAQEATWAEGGSTFWEWAWTQGCSRIWPEAAAQRASVWAAWRSCSGLKRHRWGEPHSYLQGAFGGLSVKRSWRVDFPPAVHGWDSKQIHLLIVCHPLHSFWGRGVVSSGCFHILNFSSCFNHLYSGFYTSLSWTNYSCQEYPFACC